MGQNSSRASPRDLPQAPQPAGPPLQPQPDAAARSRNRVSRADLGSLLGIGSSSSSAAAAAAAAANAPYERRESRQEREARKHERERLARVHERERSMRDESVDGGYLVTLGTYTGSEDFCKPVVRQLQIERKLMPFWRGLQDLDPKWAEHQIIAVVRGLPLPPADQPPPENFVPRPQSSSPTQSSASNTATLAVPGARKLPSEKRVSSPSSRSTRSVPPPTSSSQRTSPLKTARGPAKAIATALSVSSRNSSQTEITPSEVTLQYDPFVNGQPIEVFLYKDATECPICFLAYPPYFNHTRCCDQPICSECFVQIKRPDPHHPENHVDGEGNEHATMNPQENPEQLVSEPACCPYCQQPEFGVTYEPPPFRRGLVYSTGLGGGAVSTGTAMSSSSSLNSQAVMSPSSMTSPSSASPAPAFLGNRRRTQSLGANAPNVIMTDKIRPDWAAKLAAQRAHVARRAAAATALHAAAFMMGNEPPRGLRGRFSRRNTGFGSGENSTLALGHTASAIGGDNRPSGNVSPDGPEPVSPTTARQARIDELEQMMIMEALRLSLADEEERKRKQEKEARKEQKKRDKVERKAAKKRDKEAAKSGHPLSGSSSRFTSSSGGLYSGSASASGSSLSLGGLVGRRRGNSGATNLRMEASVASALTFTSMTLLAPGGANGSPDAGASGTLSSADKGKGVDRGPIDDPTQPSQPVSMEPSGLSKSSPPSHLRQISSNTSVSSSIDSTAAVVSGIELGESSGIAAVGKGDDQRDAEDGKSSYNFRHSLAQVVGVDAEGRDSAAAYRAAANDGKTCEGDENINKDPSNLQNETRNQRSAANDAAFKINTAAAAATPEVTVTPGTPADARPTSTASNGLNSRGAGAAGI